MNDLPEKWTYVNALTQEEQAVVNKGYPVVSTSNLAPGCSLKPHHHRHDSLTTNVILKGSLKVHIQPDTTGGAALRSTTLYGRELPAGPAAKIDQNVCYKAISWKEGCSIIEGRKLLSPHTCERYHKEGKIMPFDGQENEAQNVLVVTPHPASKRDKDI